MNKKPIANLQLSIIVNVARERCYWCGQHLRQCGMCKGTGMYRGGRCQPCMQSGWMCPTHEGDWPKG